MGDVASDSPILSLKETTAPSVFQPAKLLREARRQRGLEPAEIPGLCLLDPGGDIVRYLKRTGQTLSKVSVSTDSARGAQAGECNADESADCSFGGQAACCGQGVEAVGRELVGRDVVS